MNQPLIRLDFNHSCKSNSVSPRKISELTLLTSRAGVLFLVRFQTCVW